MFAHVSHGSIIGLMLSSNSLMIDLIRFSQSSNYLGKSRSPSSVCCQERNRVCYAVCHEEEISWKKFRGRFSFTSHTNWITCLLKDYSREALTETACMLWVEHSKILGNWKTMANGIVRGYPSDYVDWQHTQWSIVWGERRAHLSSRKESRQVF